MNCNALGKSHLLHYTGDLHYPQRQPWEEWEIQAEEKAERTPSKQRRKLRGYLQNRGLGLGKGLCGDGEREERRQSCLHSRKARERKVITDA